MSKRQSNGSWGPATRLPESVNTNGQEKSPFIHSDSHSLYFASDGHPGVGGMDLFKVEMNEDGSFSKLQNLGVPINDRENQIGVIVSADGELAYFGSESKGATKNLDVFEFKLPVRMRPEKVAIIKGEVKEDSGKPVSNATVTINYAQSGKEDVIKINEDDGSYAAVVKTSKNEDVILKVEGENIAFNAQVIAKKDDPDPADVLKLNLEAAIVAENKPFVIKDIFYTTARADINPESIYILTEFATYLKEHPSWVIEIRGHTDNTGEDKTNELLSLNRANEVKKFLVSKGVPDTQLVAVGYGEKKPIASNDTEAGKAKNRRTEFLIKNM
jgi:outer membrane protein OmpA-like peptidoglycan-associated protein